MPWILVVTLVIGASLLIVFGYCGWSLTRSLLLLTNRPPAVVRRAVALPLVYFNLFPVVFLVAYLIAGREVVPFFAGESRLIDILLVYPFWIALIIAVQLFMLLLFLGALKLLLYPLYKVRRLSWDTLHARIAVIATIVLMVYSVGVVVKDTWTIRVTEEVIDVSGEAAELDGLRVALISDLQGDGRTTERILRSFVQKTQELRPDLVLFTGDLVTSGTRYIRSTADILGELHAPLGRYAAIGDHDIFSDKLLVRDALTDNGFVVLEDTTVILDIRGVAVALSSVTETYRQRVDADDLGGLFRSSQPAPFRILLAHQPAQRLARAATRNEQTLFLAGHTHGGGIAFGIPGLFLLAPAHFESPYVTGRYQSGPTTIIVTNGLGLTLAPVRFHAPAEITLLHLRSRIP